MLYLVTGGVLIFLAVLALIVMRMPDSAVKRRKQRRDPPEPPPRDWEGIALRSEKKVHEQQQRIREFETLLRDKDKIINEERAVAGGLKRQLEQEQSWRQKEEEAFNREKERGRALDKELKSVTDALNNESSLRIKLMYDVKEGARLKDDLSSQVRRLTGQNHELVEKVRSLTEEVRSLRTENADLKRKKEADQWVAKDDFIGLEKSLKRARWELERFKKKIPEGDWPQELRPRTAPPGEANEPDGPAVLRDR
jgi:outer membrane murein-binding lipoprotein Lpp